MSAPSPAGLFKFKMKGRGHFSTHPFAKSKLYVANCKTLLVVKLKVHTLNGCGAARRRTGNLGRRVSIAFHRQWQAFCKATKEYFWRSGCKALAGSREIEANSNRWMVARDGELHATCFCQENEELRRQMWDDKTDNAMHFHTFIHPSLADQTVVPVAVPRVIPSR